MKDDGNLVRMSFSIEKELFSGLEKLLAVHHYNNRSEFIRDMIRKQLARRECADSKVVIGTISVLCDLDHTGIEEKLNKTLDSCNVKILGSSRFAIDKHFSTTMITAQGVGKDIRELVSSIRQFKGVMQTEFVITSPAARGGDE